MTQVSAGPSRRRRNRKRGCGPLGEGEIRLARRELLASVKLAANASSVKGHFDVEPGSFSLLKSIASSFERSRWERVHVMWKPAVSMTYGGLITYGVDWDFKGEDPERAGVSAFTPVNTHAVFADSTKSPLVMPPARLNTRQWYSHQSSDLFDKGPGRICYCAEGTSSANVTVLGEFWVDYSLVMQGTRS